MVVCVSLTECGDVMFLFTAITVVATKPVFVPEQRCLWLSNQSMVASYWYFCINRVYWTLLLIRYKHYRLATEMYLHPVTSSEWLLFLLFTSDSTCLLVSCSALSLFGWLGWRMSLGVFQMLPVIYSDVACDLLDHSFHMEEAGMAVKPEWKQPSTKCHLIIQRLLCNSANWCCGFVKECTSVVEVKQFI